MAKETPPKDSKEALLIAARKVFSEKGFEGTTVKDLAEAAGVNISLVSYHFGGKEGLLRACLEDFGQERLDFTRRILSKKTESASEFRLCLSLFAEDLFRCHLENREVCKILHRDADFENPIVMDVFRTRFLPMYQHLQDFIANAQNTGILRADLDPDLTTLLVFGSLIHTARASDLRKKIGRSALTDKNVLEKTVAHFVTIVCDGLLPRKEKT